MNNGIEGDVQSRMDAFRGNPQALAQRYAQDQQLIDLLALQKLKSEKDAAARQMQMQAGQGQMPTIAQQREQELMGMAKQEVAQRVGAVGQQQAQQQQKNLQQAMQGGIAQAPAPNMMTPQAMASGGIVAFAGPDGSEVKGDTDDEPRLPGESDEAYLERVGSSPFTRGLKRLGKSAMSALTAPSPIQNEEYARLMDLERNVLPQYSRGMFSRMTPEQAQAEQAVQNFYKQNKEQIVREPGLYEAFKRDPVGVAFGRVSTQREAVGKVAAPTDTSYASAEEARARARQQMVGQVQAAPAQVPPGAPPGQQPAGAVPAPGGAGLGSIALPGVKSGAMPAGAPQAAQAAQQPAQPSGLQAEQDAYLTRGLKADPETAAAVERAAYAKQFDPLYQQQRELSQQGIAQLQQRMAQQPKKDPISEFLRGMSSQRTLGMALGAGGAGITAAQKANFDQQAELEDQLQKLRETGLSAQVTQETAKYGAGDKRRTEALGLGKDAATVAGSYIPGMENAKNRAEIAERDAVIREQNRALGLDEKTSNMIRQRLAAEEKIIDAKYDRDPRTKQAMFDAAIAAQLKKERDTEYQNRKREIYAEFKKTPPEDIGAPAPTAGPAIPPPPAGAVKPKGAK